MHPRRFTSALLAICILVLFASRIPVARAEFTFRCENSWTGPSENNDVSKCLKDFANINHHLDYYAVPMILILFAVLIFVTVPIVFIFNGFCCEDYCFSFTRTTNLARSRCWLWMFINVNFFWSIFSAILIIYGITLFSNSVDRSTNYIRGDAINYFLNTKALISDLLTDYTKDPPLPPTFDLSGFDDMSSKLTSQVDSIRNNYFTYLTAARTASIVVGVLGIMLMMSCFIIAYFHLNTVGAFSFGILYYIFAVVYSIMALLLAILTCIVFAFCGEITLQNQREPGIIQWYYVPWCEKQFSFSETRDSIVNSTKDVSYNTCESILERCNTKDDSDISKPFLCGKNITTKDNCSSIEIALDVLYGTRSKTKFFDMLCVNNSKWKYQEVCNIPMCKEACIDYQKPDLNIQTWAKDVMKLVDHAVNQTTALSYVLPVMDCNFVIDKFISIYEIDKESSQNSTTYGVYCSNMRIASIMLTAGFFVGAVMFVLSIYVTQQGIWMWNDEAEVEDIKEAEAMSKYAKSICSMDQRSQTMSRMGSFAAEPRPQPSGRGILSGNPRSMSFNQMPQPTCGPA